MQLEEFQDSEKLSKDLNHARCPLSLIRHHPTFRKVGILAGPRRSCKFFLIQNTGALNFNQNSWRTGMVLPNPAGHGTVLPNPGKGEGGEERLMVRSYDAMDEGDQGDIHKRLPIDGRYSR